MTNKTTLALMKCYSEPHRRYHTIHHITDCLENIRLFEDAHPNIPMEHVRTAVWFHDAVYDAKRHDNEERSILFADKHLPKSTPQLVFGLILETKHDNLEVELIDHAVIRDVDLASLAAPYAKFLYNTNMIRHEYIHMSANDFHAGRVKFFENLLKRNIYYTKFFRERYEDAARENIMRYIEERNPVGDK